MANRYSLHGAASRIFCLVFFFSNRPYHTQSWAITSTLCALTHANKPTDGESSKNQADESGGSCYE